MNEHSRLPSPDVQTPLSGHRLALQSLCSCSVLAALTLHKRKPWIFIPRHPEANSQYKHPKPFISDPQNPETQGEAPMLLWGSVTHFFLSSRISLVFPKKGVI